MFRQAYILGSELWSETAIYFGIVPTNLLLSLIWNIAFNNKYIIIYVE